MSVWMCSYSFWSYMKTKDMDAFGCIYRLFKCSLLIQCILFSFLIGSATAQTLWLFIARCSHTKLVFENRWLENLSQLFLHAVRFFFRPINVLTNGFISIFFFVFCFGLGVIWIYFCWAWQSHVDWAIQKELFLWLISFRLNFICFCTRFAFKHRSINLLFFKKRNKM